MTPLLAAGLVLVASGGGLACGRRTLRLGLLAQSAGCLAVGVAGGWAATTDGSAGSGFTSDLTPRLGIDGLSGVFLAALGIVGAPALVYASSALAPTLRARAIGASTALFVGCLAGVLCARDPLTFLLFWELMTLVPAAIVLIGRSDEMARRTVFTYVGITHLGSVGVWVAVLLVAREGAFGDADAITRGSTVQTVVALTALVGFGTKAGVMPFHAWLPRTHPIAPAHVSALMSGVMISVGVYGLVRVLVEWLGVVPAWVGVLTLALGALSAVGGIAHALFQRDLKRTLAYSSVEHMGVILLALGASLVLRTRGEETWAAIALGAALLQTVNHAAFKALLFLAAGTFERSVGSLELDRLGGLLRRMPWTGGAFALGCAAIVALPPLNGFASEWLTLQSLLRVPASGGVADGVAGAIALGALALTAALAVLCFVQVAGLVLLGPPRRHACEEATEAPVAMRVATSSLAVLCVVLGVVPGLVLGRLVELTPWPAEAPEGLGLSLPGTGDLPTATILLLLVGATAILWHARGSRRAEPSPSWACGQPLSTSLRWTGAGFSKPVRLVYETVLRPERSITVTEHRGVVHRVAYEGRVPHLIDERLYGPVRRGALSAAHQARRLQSGTLGTYVAYLIGLVLVLLLAVRTGLLG